MQIRGGTASQVFPPKLSWKPQSRGQAPKASPRRVGSTACRQGKSPQYHSSATSYTDRTGAPDHRMSHSTDPVPAPKGPHMLAILQTAVSPASALHQRGWPDPLFYPWWTEIGFWAVDRLVGCPEARHPGMPVQAVQADAV